MIKKHVAVEKPEGSLHGTDEQKIARKADVVHYSQLLGQIITVHPLLIESSGA
jgi:hypothetical protein